RWNGNIIQAVNGEEAVKKFKQNKHIIDLVLMDLQIPILNGFEAAEQIKKTHPKIPIIALTASLDEVEFCESGRSIMQGFLIKPYVPDELYYILKEHLE
ncbi:MAG TPA: response regulator, partial [Cyclobacteriaceae bacterium]|nr:response regulator [Cyclobacteriaceae bacterium]